jgi:hypothetical protein
VFALAASFAMFGSGLGFFISKGLLYAYAFSAINRVAAGKLSGFMPELNDWTDLVQPVRAGTAALLISSGPLIVLMFLFTWQDVASRALGPDSARFISAPARPSPSPSPSLPPEIAAMLQQDSAPAARGESEDAAALPEDAAATADDADGTAAQREEARAAAERFRREMAELERGPVVPAWTVLAFLLALVWQVVYAPIALVAAAISRSFLATLNPIAGLDAIRRMGSVYWTAMAFYTVIIVAAALFGGVVSLVPVGGRLLKAFIDSYAYLAIGCLLGFAVFKKAPELNLD